MMSLLDLIEKIQSLVTMINFSLVLIVIALVFSGYYVLGAILLIINYYLTRVSRALETVHLMAERNRD